MNKKQSLYDKYNWDLESILENDTLENLYQKWIKSEEELIKYVDTFYTSLNLFKKWTKLCEENTKLSNRLSNYISNKLSEDITDPIYLGWEQKFNLKSHELSKHFIGVTNSIIKNKNKINVYLRNKELNDYQRAYDLIFKDKPHILSDENNKAINKISINNSAVGSIFSTLEQDIKFEDALDSKNKPHKLITNTDVVKNLKNKDRVLRKNSWINFNKSFNQFEHTLTQTLYYNYLKLNTYAKLHNYKDYIERTCDDDEIKFELIENLYKYVQTFKNTHEKYRKITQRKLKSFLKLKTLEPWDYSMEISSNAKKVNVEEAKNIILKGLSVLGNEYINNLKKAFDEKWISFMPKKNKYTGAYSIGGAQGLKKYYILMNFDNTYDSVSTLAHELGHSMNSLYYNNEQKIYADTTIFTAEIPSILNEVLLAMYMIKNTKDKTLVNIYIKELCDNFFGCTTRQIIFSNFEYEANKLVNEGKPFTAESLKKIYVEMKNKYTVSTKKDYKKPYSYALSTIFRINHFYHGNFYVYKYAIGQIVAICLANKIINKEKGILDKFYKFLKSGTSKSPIETIKILGIDLNSPSTYNESINFINKLLKLYNK